MPEDTKTDPEALRAKNKQTNTVKELIRKQSDSSQKLPSNLQKLMTDEKGNVV